MSHTQRRRPEPVEDSVDSAYKRMEKVGEGTYGIVYKAVTLSTGEIVAIKRIRLDNEDEGVPATAVREISVLKTIRHNHIVQLRDVLAGKGSLHLVFEFCQYDLKRFMGHKKALTPREVKRFVYQILDGLAFCHSNRILHRDLKPQNILVTESGNAVKLADFGLARAFQLPLRTYTHEVVTLWYRAPEILLGSRHYSPAMDVWSVGAIMVELATTLPFAPGESEIDQLFKIFQILGTPTASEWPGVTSLVDYSDSFPFWRRKDLNEKYPQLSPDGVDLLTRMLTYDASQRITAAEALTHRWFADLDDEPR